MDIKLPDDFKGKRLTLDELQKQPFDVNSEHIIEAHCTVGDIIDTHMKFFVSAVDDALLKITYNTMNSLYPSQISIDLDELKSVVQLYAILKETENNSPYKLKQLVEKIIEKEISDY